jgi:hypothetical protein
MNNELQRRRHKDPTVQRHEVEGRSCLPSVIIFVLPIYLYLASVFLYCVSIALKAICFHKSLAPLQLCSPQCFLSPQSPLRTIHFN